MISSRVALVFLSSAFLSLATTSTATAASPADQATAEALFEEGKKLLAAGNAAQACPKLAESQRLDPASGTALNLADCYEKLGKFASAWAGFKDAEVQARAKGNKERETEAARRAAALTPRLSKLTIVVPPTSRVPGFELRRDGSLVGEAQWGSALPVDQGHHEIVASAPGYKPWTTSVRIETEGGAASVEVPPLEKTPAADQGFRWSTQRTVGTVLGATGMVGLGVAVGFAVKGVGLNSDSLPQCQATDVSKCNAMGVSLRNQAYDAAHVADGTLAAGAVLVASGLVVFLTGAPKKADTAAERLHFLPLAGPTTAGGAVRGAW